LPPRGVKTTRATSNETTWGVRHPVPPGRCTCCRGHGDHGGNPGARSGERGPRDKAGLGPRGTYQPVQGRVVDTTTLYGKRVMGYQGWFSRAGDGSSLSRWNHGTRDGSVPTSDNIRVAMWPDLSEYDEDELYPTRLRYPDGSVAQRYSAWNLKTVMRRFRRMRDFNLDGAFHYRFGPSRNSVGRSPAERPTRGPGRRGLLGRG
jgi:hypothetical protein